MTDQEQNYLNALLAAKDSVKIMREGGFGQPSHIIILVQSLMQNFRLTENEALVTVQAAIDAIDEGVLELL